jgi:CHAT domain-containing protein
MGMVRVLLLLLVCSPFAAQVAASSSSDGLGSSPRGLVKQAQTLADKGRYGEAVPGFRDASRLYAAAGAHEEEIKSLILLSHAYQHIGFYGEAQLNLDKAMTTAEKTGSRKQMASVLGSLGNLYIATGPKDKALEYLDRGLSLARQEKDELLVAAILNNRGNLFASEKRYADALETYNGSVVSAENSGHQGLIAKGLSNAAMVAADDGRNALAHPLADRALDVLAKMEDTGEKAYLLTNVGLTYERLSKAAGAEGKPFVVRPAKAFEQAIQTAENIGDSRALSYAAGYMGRLLEAGDDQKSLDLTRRAVYAAQLADAPESLYLWQWQAGRLLKKAGQRDDAITAYKNSIYTLRSIRQEMSTCYGGPAVSFRESVEPIYSQFLDLLLTRAATVGNAARSESDLIEAREVVESLKAAELRDYFQDECVDAARAKTTRLDLISSLATVIYPIVLPDRTELLVNLPTGLKQFSVPVTKERLTREILEFRKKLENRTTYQFLPHAQQLYDWLIRPIEKDLASVKVETLVFVPDGPLRTIPMAALHDGKQFLVEKFAIAITPGLDLSEPRAIKRENVRVLAAGLTESVQGYAPLPYIAAELREIGSLYRTDTLMNRNFLSPGLERELQSKNFSILHIASHGKFDNDVNNTFILTFDNKLTMEGLSRCVGLFRSRNEPLELLTLSACETAAGDEKAALGLAGISIRAGAKSAIATLWHINDLASSSLIIEFYRQLANPEVSRAVALKKAQLKLLDDRGYSHPGYWAPFLLVNNWL